MTGRLLVLWAMPGPWPGASDPDPDGFSDVVLAAMTEERRALAGPLRQDDIRRFTTVSIAIERIARARGTALATVTAETISAWLASGEAPARAAAGFHLPSAAADWLNALSSFLPAEGLRVLSSAARQVAASGDGLVLSPAPVPEGPLLPSSRLPDTADEAAGRPDPAAASAFRYSMPGWRPFAGHASQVESASRLWEQIAAAVDAGEPVLVGGGARHVVLAEALRSALDVMIRPVDVRILYVDASEAVPFRLWPALADRSDARSGHGGSIRLGLMSMRHTEADLDVDGYWFRNRLVSTSRTFAETDAFCAAETERKLTELHDAGIRRIELIQTGFEPAVLGFYRGALRWLGDGGGMRIQPLYRIGHRLVDGTPWGS